MVNIGIDFDGVITNPIGLKIKLAKEILGLKLTPKTVSKENLLSSGMDFKTYDKVFRGLISSKRRYEIRLSHYARQILNKLYKTNKIYVITSRHDYQIHYIKDWLKHKKIKYHVLINTSDKSKDQSCIKNNIKIYLDDDTHKLEKIKNRFTHLFLLTRGHNKDISNQELEKNNIHRIKNWKKFYNRIKYLL